MRGGGALTLPSFSEWFCSRRARVLNLLLCLLLGALLRAPAVLALTVDRFPDCPDFFRTLAVNYEDWALVSRRGRCLTRCT